MLKKLLFLCLLILISININYVSAETALIIPLKKPSLSDNEIKHKISKNILKPLKKPKKTESIKITEKKIVEVKNVKKDKNKLKGRRVRKILNQGRDIDFFTLFEVRKLDLFLCLFENFMVKNDIFVEELSD